MQTMVYIGPTIKYVVQSGTAFQNGYTPKMEALIKIEPFVSELIIPLPELAQAVKEIRVSGSRLNMLHQRAKKIGGKH